MQVFYHLVYEYQKGLRDLCLYTGAKDKEIKIKTALEGQNIDYTICQLPGGKINVFFGSRMCLDIVKQFSCSELNNISVEEDFILGMMLGYAKSQQYERFLARKKICA